MACTEVLHRGSQAIVRRGSEQRCGTVCAIWGLYRCALLTGRAYAHPGSTSMAAGVLCAASCPTPHTSVSSLADKRGQPEAVAQRLSTRHEDAIGSAQVREPRSGLTPSPEHCG